MDWFLRAPSLPTLCLIRPLSRPTGPRHVSGRKLAGKRGARAPASVRNSRANAQDEERSDSKVQSPPQIECVSGGYLVNHFFLLQAFALRLLTARWRSTVSSSLSLRSYPPPHSLAFGAATAVTKVSPEGPPKQVVEGGYRA